MSRDRFAPVSRTTARGGVLQRRLLIAACVLTPTVVVGSWAYLAVEQRAAVAGIIRLGGSVYYDRDVWPFPEAVTAKLASVLGDDAVYPAVTVCPHEESIDQVIPHLKRLRGLRTVGFWGLLDPIGVTAKLNREVPRAEVTTRGIITY